MKRLFAAALLLLAGCANKHTDYTFKMDYPVEAARLSLGGDIHVNIDCATREMKVISDSSNGIFSRHVNKRLSNICYKKTDKLDVIYRFNAAKGVRQDMIATQYPRVPPVSNTDKLSDRDS
ncbi:MULTISPECIES: hypothetical protein [Enterobacteriaceae]|uniref:hypothetical protein n=1 Tax=Enterobacteriaceae TaxID=543 RepID=UPI00057922CF|nr:MULTISPECIES: hypothetical protein [Enterobacteriaceae]HCM9139950.1 hypothetical protein [Enterobacter cloacae subsp. cloacae]EKX4035462.1 hypothetical protein [Enterobacter cloacae]MCK7102257.1 hypothetical protein [Enterobacter cloacae]MCK7163747.1 hypothetical protein [Enterobacter cloacae]HAS0909279.1 hypothetical protein [Enterobacter cloacae]